MTWEGSISSISDFTWRNRSALDGLIGKLLNCGRDSWNFTKCSEGGAGFEWVSYAAHVLPRNRLLLPAISALLAIALVACARIGIFENRPFERWARGALRRGRDSRRLEGAGFQAERPGRAGGLAGLPARPGDDVGVRAGGRAVPWGRTAGRACWWPSRCGERSTNWDPPPGGGADGLREHGRTPYAGRVTSILGGRRRCRPARNI